MIFIAKNIGDSFTYTLPPITRALSFDDFVDDIVNETQDRYFVKSYQYALEGLFFTDIQALSSLQLQSIVSDPKRSYVFQVTYTRAGSDSTGDLTLNSVSLSCTFATADNGNEYNNSNFVKFFDSTDPEVEAWALNVLKKIFEPGSLAKYVLRGKDVTEIIEESSLKIGIGYDKVGDPTNPSLEDILVT
jgi:hypothetical protein